MAFAMMLGAAVAGEAQTVPLEEARKSINPRLVVDSSRTSIRFTLDQDAFVAVFERIFPDGLRMIYPNPGQDMPFFAAGDYPFNIRLGEEPDQPDRRQPGDTSRRNKGLTPGVLAMAYRCQAGAAVCQKIPTALGGSQNDLSPFRETVSMRSGKRTLMLIVLDRQPDAKVLRGVALNMRAIGDNEHMLRRIGERLAGKIKAQWEGLLIP